MRKREPKPITRIWRSRQRGRINGIVGRTARSELPDGAWRPVRSPREGARPRRRSAPTLGIGRRRLATPCPGARANEHAGRFAASRTRCARDGANRLPMRKRASSRRGSRPRTETYASWPRRCTISSRVWGSNSRIVPSPPATAIRVPSGWNLTAWTSPRLVPRGPSSSPEPASHTCASPVVEAVTIRRPSGLNATVFVWSSTGSIRTRADPARPSRMTRLVSESRSSSRVPSGDQAKGRPKGSLPTTSRVPASRSSRSSQVVPANSTRPPGANSRHEIRLSGFVGRNTLPVTRS